MLAGWQKMVLPPCMIASRSSAAMLSRALTASKGTQETI